MKMTKLCCFNQDIHFSVLKHHAELDASERVHWEVISDPKLSKFEPLNYHIWGTMLEEYHKLQTKPKMTDELKVTLQTIWNQLPQEHINKTVANFTKCLTAHMAVAVNSGHSKHLH